MSFPDGLSLGFAVIALVAVGACFIVQLLGRRRFHELQKEVKRLSEDLLQVVELQAETYGKMRRGLADIEEKVLELSVPSADAPLPLERRHQVMTLARNGVAVDEIARRLNMPKGEAELILSLRRYADAKSDGSRAPAPKRSAGHSALAG